MRARQSAEEWLWVNECDGSCRNSSASHGARRLPVPPRSYGVV